MSNVPSLPSKVLPSPKPKKLQTTNPSEEELENAERPKVPCLPVGERLASFAEVDLCLSEEAAVCEARRCLRCDLQTRDAKEQLEAQQPEERRSG